MNIVAVGLTQWKVMLTVQVIGFGVLWKIGQGHHSSKLTSKLLLCCIMAVKVNSHMTCVLPLQSHSVWEHTQKGHSRDKLKTKNALFHLWWLTWQSQLCHKLTIGSHSYATNWLLAATAMPQTDYWHFYTFIRKVMSCHLSSSSLYAVF